MQDQVPSAEMPMTVSPRNVREERLEDCTALCLSGGGYRAMLFHLGVLWYLDDAGYLKKLGRISSVSGGSITSGVLALAWPKLTGGDAFQRHVVGPLRRMASTTVDARSVLGGIFGSGSVSDRVIKRYREILFGDRTLQDLPDEPRFVFNSTNVQTGSLMRFSKPYIGDWQVGLYRNPTRLLAEAVAASSAFPPVLSPVRLRFKPGDFVSEPGHLNRPPFTTEVMLTDGGVYDNMGIETAWKRCRSILVSDAGGKMQPEDKPGANWASHSLRINSLIDNQVRSLRKRQLIWSFDKKERNGAYWGMWTDPQKFPASSQLSLPSDKANALARTPTRLAARSDELQERLINFGYGMAERAIRSHFDPNALAAARFPYSRGI